MVLSTVITVLLVSAAPSVDVAADGPPINASVEESVPFENVIRIVFFGPAASRLYFYADDGTGSDAVSALIAHGQSELAESYRIGALQRTAAFLVPVATHGWVMTMFAAWWALAPGQVSDELYDAGNVAFAAATLGGFVAGPAASLGLSWIVTPLAIPSDAEVAAAVGRPELAAE